MRKTIVHIIHDLGRGGAETMLVAAVNELSDYNNIVVTLFEKNHFKEELQCEKYYSLNLKSLLQLPLAILKLKKIIKENNADIVHSHLFWPTIISRLATPRNITVVTTIHAFIASSMEYKSRYIRVLDALTFRSRRNVIIAVAKGAEEEYFKFLKLKPHKAYTLYTFADPRIFNSSKALPKKESAVFRIITVGALRKQKNQQFLLEAFKHLNKQKFQLDIYGDGELDLQLRSFIKDHDLNVNLKGAVKNLPDIINSYDLFVMSSNYEGFALSVLEAMAMEMPLLLSDISSFREQCESTAEYFSLNGTSDFIGKLNQLCSDKLKLQLMARKGKERMMANFTLDHHMANLRNIYRKSNVRNERYPVKTLDYSRCACYSTLL